MDGWPVPSRTCCCCCCCCYYMHTIPIARGFEHGGWMDPSILSFGRVVGFLSRPDVAPAGCCSTWPGRHHAWAKDVNLAISVPTLPLISLRLLLSLPFLSPCLLLLPSQLVSFCLILAFTTFALIALDSFCPPLSLGKKISLSLGSPSWILLVCSSEKFTP